MFRGIFGAARLARNAPHSAASGGRRTRPKIVGPLPTVFANLVMVAASLGSMITAEQAEAWNAYCARVGEQLGSKGKGVCAVEFAGLGVLGRGDEKQKAAALKLLPGFMKQAGHPQMCVPSVGPRRRRACPSIRKTYGLPAGRV